MKEEQPTKEFPCDCPEDIEIVNVTSSTVKNPGSMSDPNVTEEEIQDAVDIINPDENSMESRG